MYEFAYQRPNDLAAATALTADEDAKIIAGGMTLIPTLKQRLARPSALIDLARIGSLRFVRREGDMISVGAMTTHAEVAASDIVQTAIPGLAGVAGVIGDPQVRHRGTIGGSIANCDPAADYPAALVALGATVVTDRRALAAEDFFVAMFETALEPGEIITEVRFPIPVRSAYAKFRNPASRYAVVGIYVAATNNGVRVAATGAGPAVFRLTAFEAALERSFTPDAVASLAVSADGLNEDLHASAAYRARLITVMAERAIAEALSSRP